MSIAAVSNDGSSVSAPSATVAARSDEMSQFLRLLTAQIENQDPLEPMEANQFIEQLATINALEQQIRTNDQLAEIVTILRGEEAN